MSTRPKALRLAEAIDPLTRYTLDNLTCSAAAAELRRLHELNTHLLEALEFCAGTSYITDAHEVASTVIAKATEATC